MKIRNYTSTVPVERTVSRIEEELVKVGATHIEKKYEKSELKGIIFSIDIGQKISFKIPAQIEASYEIIRQIKEYKGRNKDWLIAQSKRTAWRLIYDWIQIQVAMIQLKQADAMQVFLPYAYNPKTEKTIYQSMQGNNFKLLTE